MWLGRWILLRALLWTMLPLVVLRALPVDLVEGVIWGQGWQLGYDQPPLQAWLIGAVDALSGHRREALFLTSQILVASCLLSVWRLAASIVTPLGALVSVLLLEGVFYLNFGSPNLFPDLIAVPFWAGSIGAFHRALRRQHAVRWAILGLWLAAAAHAKYVSAVLAVVMIAFLIFDPHARRSFRTSGPYLCAGLCLALLVPHLGWAMRNDFPTVAHVGAVSRPTAGAVDVLLSFLGFAGGQVLVVLGLVLLVRALSPPPGADAPIRLAGDLRAFDRRFVAAMAMGPLLLVLAGAALGGIQFRVHWTYAMWSCAGLFVVVFVVPATDAERLRGFGRVFAGWIALMAVAYVGANRIAPLLEIPHARAKSARSPVDRILREVQQEAKHGLERLQREASFPSDEIATMITQEWRRQLDVPLAYVIGNKWVAGNVGFFSPDHPLVVRDGDPTRSPWIDADDLRRRGAAVVWNPDFDTNGIAAALERRFPTMERQPTIVIPNGSSGDRPPVRIMWGILRPSP
ncbi:MAG: glycosyltransferase family 39 protein [Myxococcota bacterium]